jgi:hypothetical protein
MNKLSPMEELKYIKNSVAEIIKINTIKYGYEISLCREKSFIAKSSDIFNSPYLFVIIENIFL